MSVAEEAPTKAKQPRYKRVLLKISGEALMADRDFGLDPGMIGRIAKDVREVHRLGIEVCLVVGGGNIFRGLAGAAAGMDRTTGCYIQLLQ